MKDNELGLVLDTALTNNKLEVRVFVRGKTGWHWADMFEELK